MVPSIWCILDTNKVIKDNAMCSFRIAWCLLFSYFISELWRDGLWACSQLISYSWWGCEYNIYCCWQNYTFDLLVRSWCIWAILLLAMVFSRASRRCFSLNLSVGSLTWLTYTLWDALSKDIAPGEFWFSNVHANFLLDWALQLMYVQNQFWLLYHQAAC